ncbi:MAG TPA: hypothetical protein VMJ66_08340 [Geobacteraceae bacterium]|nr:hypothetical protein [Geobacteraceae bacterium]
MDIDTRHEENSPDLERDQVSRRDFLTGLGKWSKVVIGAALFGGSLLASRNDADAYGAAWANRGGGGGWVNRYGGGGTAWGNHGGGGTAWGNHGGGGAWANRGGGGTAWGNHGGGTGWVNRY